MWNPQRVVDTFRRWVDYNVYPMSHHGWGAQSMLGGARHVIQFEHDRERGIRALFAMYGLESPAGPMPHENDSCRTIALADYYDARTRGLVASACAWEIKRFGYSEG